MTDGRTDGRKDGAGRIAYLVVAPMLRGFLTSHQKVVSCGHKTLQTAREPAQGMDRTGRRVYIKHASQSGASVVRGD